jgi:tRNA(Ile)-lysidine synthase
MVTSTLISFCKTHDISNCSVIVAVSGGADSTALLTSFSKISKQLSLKIVAAHVNYHLRDEDSNLDEEYLKQLCSNLSIKLTTFQSPLNSDDSAIEEKARDIRYRFFEEVKKGEGAKFIATAHNANDQAETLLFRLIRGTGLTGASGISSFRDDQVIRPLLSIKRDEIEKWLRDEKIEWREDRSNCDTKFSRNLIRQKITPLLEQINSKAIDNLCNFSDEIKLHNRESQLSSSWLEKCMSYFSTSLAILQKNGETPTTEAIHSLFLKLKIEPNRKIITLIRDRWNESGIELLLPDSFSVHLLKNRAVFISKKESEHSKRYEFTLNLRESVTPTNFIDTISLDKECSKHPIFDKNNSHVFVNISSLPLKIRAVTEYDKLTPFGTKSSINCNKLLKKSGVTKWERERYPLVLDSNNQPLWLPNIAFSELGRVNSKEELYKLSIEKLNLT